MQITWTYGTVSQDVQISPGEILNWSNLEVVVAPSQPGPFVLVAAQIAAPGMKIAEIAVPGVKTGQSAVPGTRIGQITAS